MSPVFSCVKGRINLKLTEHIPEEESFICMYKHSAQVPQINGQDQQDDVETSVQLKL